LTLRDDFLVRAQSAPALRDRLSQAVEILTTPDAGDLLRILVEPARRAGYGFDDPTLPTEMVDAVVDKPGGLALLSFTAASLWEVRDRDRRRLTRSGYQALGGVAGALAQHAEATLATLAREQRNLVREAFRHLITAEGTRAILSRADLVQLLGGGEDAQAVLERLIAARLLVTQEGESGEDRIEIAHEALVSAWPRLAEWVREDAESARSRDHLRTAARQWDERGRPRALLMRDEALVDYRRWQAKSPGPLTALERTFADTSLREEARGRRIRRISLAAIAIAASGALVTLLWLNGRAKEQRHLAEENLLSLYEEQGRQALLARDYFRALPYLSAARAGGRSGPALRFMLAEAMRPLRQRPLVLTHHDAPTWVKFSPDGKELVTTSGMAPVASLWSSDGRLLHTLRGKPTGPGAGIFMATFDAGGGLVATAGRDGTAGIWSSADGRLVASLSHPTAVVWVAFSPSGDRLATACEDGRVRLFSRQGALVATLDTGSPVSHIAWSAAGDRLASASQGGARLWDPGSGTLVRTLEEGRGSLTRIAFAPDGQTVATASADGTVRLHSIRDGSSRTLSGHRAAIYDLAISPDGTRLVTASADSSARLWAMPGGELVASLEGHGDVVWSAVFSADGSRVLTGSFDGTARLWDRDGTPLGVLIGHSSLVYGAVFDPTGERIATVGLDGSARIWSAKVRSTVRFLIGHQGAVKSERFSSDGRRLLTVSADRTARIWNVATGAELDRIAIPADVENGFFLPGDRFGWIDGKRLRITDAEGAARGPAIEIGSAVRTAEISPQGDRLVVITLERRAIVWDLATGAKMASFPASSAAFGQDGRTIVAIGMDGQTEVWDAVTGGRRLAFRAHRAPTWSAVACGGGKRILTVGADGTLRHWDAVTGAFVRSVSLKVNYSGLEVTRDCNFIAAMGDNHLATLLDASTGQPLNFIDSRPSAPVWIAANPQGTRVAAIDGDRVGIWDIELASEPADEVAALTRCVVPYRVVGAEFVPTATEPSNCAGH
jgi:WD40 repeat protein